MVMDNAKTSAAQGNSESATTHRTGLFIKLFCVPAGIIFPFFLLPWPASLVASLIIATLFEKGKYLSSFCYLVACLGALVLPLIACFDANYLHVVILLCAVYAGYGWWTLATSTKKWLANIWGLPVMLVFFALTVAASLGIQRIPWIPYPAWCERSIVKFCDYGIMEKFFGMGLPSSFRIMQVYYRPYFFPAPDGPCPVQYEVCVSAAGYQDLVNAVQMEKAGDDGRDVVIRRFYSSKEFHNDLYDEAINSMDNSHYRPPSVYIIKKAGWLCLDERTSPSLRIFISTTLPYRAER